MLSSVRTRLQARSGNADRHSSRTDPENPIRVLRRRSATHAPTAAHWALGWHIHRHIAPTARPGGVALTATAAGSLRAASQHMRRRRRSRYQPLPRGRRRRSVPHSRRRGTRDRLRPAALPRVRGRDPPFPVWRREALLSQISREASRRTGVVTGRGSTGPRCRRDGRCSRCRNGLGRCPFGVACSSVAGRGVRPASCQAMESAGFSVNIARDGVASVPAATGGRRPLAIVAGLVNAPGHAWTTRTAHDARRRPVLPPTGPCLARLRRLGRWEPPTRPAGSGPSVRRSG